MPVLLALDLVATLQHHARAAVTADIGGGRSIQRVGSVGRREEGRNGGSEAGTRIIS